MWLLVKAAFTCIFVWQSQIFTVSSKIMSIFNKSQSIRITVICIKPGFVIQKMSQEKLHVIILPLMYYIEQQIAISFIQART